MNNSSLVGKVQSLGDGAYLSDMVGKICGVITPRHFPEVSGIDDVARLWEQPGFPASGPRQKEF
jgi:hypothetical protein